MVTEFKFPDVGEGIIEGEIVKWRVRVGEKIKEDQILVDVETDKAVVEVPSPTEGVIINLHCKEGDVINVGEVLVTIGTEEELGRKKDKGTVVGVLEEAEEPAAKKAPSKVLATPVVRKIAKDLSIDLSKVKGTGPGGRITKEDLQKFREESTGIKEADDSHGPVTRVPLRGIRKAIAKHMAFQQHDSANVTHIDEADVTELMEIREKEKSIMTKKGKNLTFLPFVIKAVVIGLKEYPILNSTLDMESGEIIIKNYYNIGIAVDTDDGLMVPVIKNADKKNILTLADSLGRIAEDARARKIDLKDLKGSTFTITNIGGYGGIFATPIINYPEAAILATGRIQEKPVVIDGEIKIRKVLPLSLTFDHRLMDGATVAKFLKTVSTHLEDPGLLLVELQ
ncbi:MAG: dihydrolipoamide acetyltransferase family protein [Nitrospinota bacterium]